MANARAAAVAIKGSSGGVEDESTELPIGSLCWIPSSATQLQIKLPPDLKDEVKPAYYPGTVISPTEFQLDWDHTVKIKCPWALVERRGKQKNLGNEEIVLNADSATSSVEGDLMKLDQCNSATCVALICRRLAEDRLSTRVTGNVSLWVNPMNRRGSAGSTNDSMRMQRVLDLSCEGENVYGIKSFSHESIYSFIETARRALLDSKSPQTIIVRGCAGSGKSETIKTALQYLLFSSATVPVRRGSTAKRASLKPPPVSNDTYQRLGSRLNPIIQNPQSQQVGNRLMASISLFECFLTAPSGINSHSSRSLRRCRVNFDLDKATICGVEATAAIIDPSRFRSKSSTHQAFNIFPIILSFLSKEAPTLLQQHNPGEESMASYLPQSQAEIDAAADDGVYLRHVLREAGLRDEQWDDACKALLAIVLLQSVVIVGNESAGLSSGSKPTIASVESLLGAPIDSLTELVLRKSDPMNPKLGMIDNSPSESRIVLDQLSAAVYNSLLTFISTTCCEKSMIEPVAFSGPPPPEYVGFSYIDLVEFPGFEIFDATQPGGIVSFAYNYADERMLPYFLSSSLAKEMAVYATEGLEQPLLSQPNVQTSIDIIDKPNAALGGSKIPPGIISTLEETCQGMRPDDKSFCEKILASHSKSKSVRGGGHKSKATQFSVKHFFGEVSYDAEGWVQQNKARITDALGNFVQSCVIPSFIKDVKADDEGPQSNKPAPGRSAGDKAVLVKNMLLTKCRDSLSRLMSSLENASAHHLLCLRPTEKAQAGSNLHDSSYMAPQIRQLLIPTLAQVNIVGYPVRIEFAKFYETFRPAVPFGLCEEGLPVSLDKALPVPPEMAEKLIHAMYANVEKLRPCNYGAFTVNHIRKSSLKPTVGVRCVFLSLEGEHLFRSLLAYTDSLFGRAASLVQSGARKKLAVRHVASMKKAAILLRAHVFRWFFSRRFAAARKAIMLIQRAQRRFIHHKRYRDLQRAVAVVKRRLKTGGMLQRVRFLKLSRSARVLHGLAKGLLIRQRIYSVTHSVFLLQRAARTFLRNFRVFHRQRDAAITIQRLARGRSSRRQNARKIYALVMRMRQRVGARCVRQLQGAFRAREVRRRYRRLIAATLAVQRWCRFRNLRNRFLRIVLLVRWFQTHTRRRQALNRFTLMQAAKMLLVEHARLNEVREHEVEAALSLPPSASSGGSVVQVSQMNDLLGPLPGVLELSALPGRTSTGSQVLHTLHRRHLLSFDVGCDIVESYPKGWLAPVIELQASLMTCKASIAHIACGAHHTIIIDSLNRIHAMGLGDVGQFGNGEKSRRSLPTPTLMETCSSTIARDELTHSKKAQAAYDPLAHRMPDPNRLSAIAVPAAVAAVCCGRDHAMLLTSTSLVWAWGGNKKGQCGNRSFDPVFRPSLVCVEKRGSSHSSTAPGAGTGTGTGTATLSLRESRETVVPLRGVKKIVTASYASGCLLESGVLYTWGSAECLGRPAIAAAGKDCPDPSPVPFFSQGSSSLGKLTVHTVDFGDAHCIALATSAYKSLSLRDSADVFAWGANVCGQLGVGEQYLKGSATPLRVRLPIDLGSVSDVRVEGERDRGQGSVHIACGGRHTLLCVRGDLWAWGWNAFGQCGRLTATGENIYVPVQIPIHKPTQSLDRTRSRESWLSGRSSITGSGSLGAGAKTALAVDALPGATSVGLRGSGAWGGSNNSTRLGTVVSISAGWRHSCCLSDTGMAFFWGRIAPVSPFFSTDPIDPLPPAAEQRSATCSVSATVLARSAASRSPVVCPPSLLVVPTDSHGFVSGLWTIGGGSILALGVTVCDYDPWTDPLAHSHVHGPPIPSTSAAAAPGGGGGKENSKEGAGGDSSGRGRVKDARTTANAGSHSKGSIISKEYLKSVSARSTTPGSSSVSQDLAESSNHNSSSYNNKPSFNAGFKPVLQSVPAGDVQDEFRKRLGGFKASSFLSGGPPGGKISTASALAAAATSKSAPTKRPPPAMQPPPPPPAAKDSASTPAHAQSTLPVGPQSAKKRDHIVKNKLLGGGESSQPQAFTPAHRSASGAASREVFPAPPLPPSAATAAAAAAAGDKDHCGKSKPGGLTTEGLLAYLVPPPKVSQPIGYELTSAAYFDSIKTGARSARFARSPSLSLEPGSGRGVGMPLSDKKNVLKRLQKRASTGAPSFIVAAAQAATLNEVQQYADAVIDQEQSELSEREKRRRAFPGGRASMPALSPALLPPSSPALSLYGSVAQNRNQSPGLVLPKSKPGTEIIDDMLSSVRRELNSIRQAFTFGDGSSSNSSIGGGGGGGSAAAAFAKGGNRGKTTKDTQQTRARTTSGAGGSGAAAGTIPDDISFYGYPVQPQYRPLAASPPNPVRSPRSPRSDAAGKIASVSVSSVTKEKNAVKMAPTAMQELAFLIKSLRSEDL